MLNISINKARELEVHIPSPSGKSRVVTIPITPAGCKVLRSLLAEREDIPLARATIGTPASPTQDMLNTFLRSEQRREELEKVTAKKEVSPVLEKYGLEGITLDI